VGEFNVYWWDRDGGQHEELRGVDAERAVLAAKRLCAGPAATLGVVARVIVTDGDDFCNFEWRRGEGVIFGFSFVSNEVGKTT
jgi:hypothetical protein